METCNICMEEVFLPVEMTCFDCFTENKIGCSSFHRTCMKCAHTYLQLDLNVHERDFTKRCLYCCKVVHLRFLNCENSYRKDFLLMKTDDRINIESNEIINKKNPMINNDGYEWTENFDGKIIKNNNIYYFN